MWRIDIIQQRDLTLCRSWLEDLMNIQYSIGQIPSMPAKSPTSSPSRHPSPSRSRHPSSSPSRSRRPSSSPSRRPSSSPSNPPSSSPSNPPSSSPSNPASSPPSKVSVSSALKPVPSPTTAVDLVRNNGGLPAMTATHVSAANLTYICRTFINYKPTLSLEWLLLPSLELFAPKGSHIVIVFDPPRSDNEKTYHQKLEAYWKARLHAFNFSVVIEPLPPFFNDFAGIFMHHSKGYDMQQWTTFYFDQHSATNNILVMDTDSSLSNFMVPKFVLNDEGMLFNWATRGQTYERGTQMALDTPRQHINAMFDGFPVFMRADTLKNIRGYIQDTWNKNHATNITFDRVMMTVLNGSASQFNIISNYALLNEHDKYSWFVEWPHNYPMWGWHHSHGQFRRNGRVINWCKSYCRVLYTKDVQLKGNTTTMDNFTGSEYCKYYTHNPSQRSDFEQWSSLFSSTYPTNYPDLKGKRAMDIKSNYTKMLDLNDFQIESKVTHQVKQCVPRCGEPELDRLQRVKNWASVAKNDGRNVVTTLVEDRKCDLIGEMTKKGVEAKRSFEVRIEWGAKREDFNPATESIITGTGEWKEGEEKGKVKMEFNAGDPYAGLVLILRFEKGGVEEEVQFKGVSDIGSVMSMTSSIFT
eukprot:TRINITY_DN2162_c0_g1_i1.p1 TRINITY_DN2162_c0_g1~~TRINITY_DN2162_c0_g1_i1.p1  ORF type:complete len:726 (+),score=148.02 TRINITY_DN2162_c0_g1_i1:265-2178(+)